VLDTTNEENKNRSPMASQTGFELREPVDERTSKQVHGLGRKPHALIGRLGKHVDQRNMYTRSRVEVEVLHHGIEAIDCDNSVGS
jgi:hypothetical protein